MRLYRTDTADLSVVVLEKRSQVGAYILSGAILCLLGALCLDPRLAFKRCASQRPSHTVETEQAIGPSVEKTVRPIGETLMQRFEKPIPTDPSRPVGFGTTREMGLRCSMFIPRFTVPRPTSSNRGIKEIGVLS